MIELINLCKEFKKPVREEGLKGMFKTLFSRKYTVKKAVNNVSFKIDDGEIVGYIGSNGAGKSTSIKMMCGILTPTSGKVLIDDVEISLATDDFVLDFEEEYIYSLTWEAYIKDVNADSLTSRKGFIQNFEVISFRAYNDPEDFARFGFGYNLIGKPKGDSGTDAAEMLFYGYKLYNRMLTPEEVTRNVNIDSARLFY